MEINVYEMSDDVWKNHYKEVKKYAKELFQMSTKKDLVLERESIGKKKTLNSN